MVQGAESIYRKRGRAAMPVRDRDVAASCSQTAVTILNQISGPAGSPPDSPRSGRMWRKPPRWFQTTLRNTSNNPGANRPSSVDLLEKDALNHRRDR